VYHDEGERESNVGYQCFVPAEERPLLQHHARLHELQCVFLCVHALPSLFFVFFSEDNHRIHGAVWQANEFLKSSNVSHYPCFLGSRNTRAPQSEKKKEKEKGRSGLLVLFSSSLPTRLNASLIAKVHVPNIPRMQHRHLRGCAIRLFLHFLSLAITLI
jgi:hypothetical protein